MVVEQPEKFLYFTATGWTAIGSIISAVSIFALSIFNWFYLRAAERAAVAAEAAAAAAQRPVVVIHSEYSEEMNGMLVWAHNQGSGPALDVEAQLRIDPTPGGVGTSYAIGCLPADGKFQFLIGNASDNLTQALIWYRSVAGEQWTTKTQTISGNPIATKVAKGNLYRDSSSPSIVDLL